MAAGYPWIKQLSSWSPVEQKYHTDVDFRGGIWCWRDYFTLLEIDKQWGLTAVPFWGEFRVFYQGFLTAVLNRRRRFLSSLTWVSTWSSLWRLLNPSASRGQLFGYRCVITNDLVVVKWVMMEVDMLPWRLIKEVLLAIGLWNMPLPFGLKLKRTRRYTVSSKSCLVTRIQLLNGEFVEFTLSVESTGQECLEAVAQRLELREVCMLKMTETLMVVVFVCDCSSQVSGHLS